MIRLRTFSNRFLKSKTILLMSLCTVSHYCTGATDAADKSTLYDKCLLKEIKFGDEFASLAQIKEACLLDVEAQLKLKKGRISNRIIEEKSTAFNPYVITPHKMNYILPATVTDNINKTAYGDTQNWQENLENTEAKFQLSIKVPLNTRSIFTQGDGLFFGFTLQSWWQLYSDDISKPFRETNYQPEFFYLAPLNWHPFDGNTGFMLGAEHESNGRTQLLSRSWNRVYANFLYEKGNFAFSFRPWWRIPEDEKQSNLSSDGDDNPDIGHYMGHFELGMVYKWSDYELSFKGRENFVEHHGSMELGFTFPLWGRLRGYAQYTNGYGESLIDYNHSQQRFGLGIALTNVL